ncbi:MAG: peptidyl-prolyl cis-trans isomerase [Chloroflexota bacterium]|nr:peptidyl-prolyl cis-trans isomerase [Chloroflexota bacterium]
MSFRRGLPLSKFSLSAASLAFLTLILAACSTGNQAASVPTSAPATEQTSAGGDAAPTSAPTSSQAAPGPATTSAPTGPAGATATVPGSGQPNQAEAPAASGQVDRTKPAAVVNGEPITFEELDTRLERQFASQIIDDLIVEKLLAQEARRRNVTVTPAEVAQEEQRARTQLREQFDQVVQQFGSVEAFRDRLRLNVYLRKLLAPQIKVGAPQIQEYYNQNKQQFATPEEISVQQVVTDSQQAATAAARELSAGAKLPAVIQKHGSKQPERARQSRDLGFTQVQTLPQEIALTVANLQPGKASEPIPQEDGSFAVVRLAGKRGGQVPPLAQIRAQVEEAARDTRLAELAPQFIQELRSKGQINSQFAPAPPQQPAP